MALTLHEVLLQIREHGPTLRDCGICENLRRLLNVDEVISVLNPFFREWPEFSGNIEYPVPGATYYFVDDKWDPDTEYGRARWRLLDFLIERTAP